MVATPAISMNRHARGHGAERITRHGHNPQVAVIYRFESGERDLTATIVI